MGAPSSEFPLLQSRTLTSIASLSSDLPDPAARAILGEISLIWPYKAAAQTLAFRLTDHDTHGGRTKGQVHIQLDGACAKELATLSIGDRVAVAIDGAKWVENKAVGRPGFINWQLHFKEKLTLQARIGSDQELKEVNIDHQEPEVPKPSAASPSQPQAEETPTIAGHASNESSVPVPKPLMMELDEYPSPAFMKRARLSYGALFEDLEEKFEDDGGVKGKGRKRSRFGRDSNSWRYTSQSPSPTSEAEPVTPEQTTEITETTTENPVVKPSPAKPQMADEGCQTMDVEVVSTPAKHQTEVSSNNTAETQSSPPREASPHKDVSKPTSTPSRSLLPTAAVGDTHPEQLPATKTTDSDQQPVALTTPPQTAAARGTFGSSTLFGNSSRSNINYDEANFDPRSSAGAGVALDIANQVRFGFFHAPQTPQAPQQPPPQPEQSQQPQQLSHSAPAAQRLGEDAYPESHLEPSDPTKYADMETYVNQAEQEMEMEPQYAYAGDELNPPITASFVGAQYDMDTQAQAYNPFEGGHYGEDALDEGSRITTGGYALHNGEIDIDKVPPGFASFGGGVETQIIDDQLEDDEDDEDGEEPHIPGKHFVKNDEVEDDFDDDVALEDNDETEYGPDGEVIETGDYDQRQYNIPEEDDDELSLEDEQNELQALAQDNEPDVVDEEDLIDDRMEDQEDDENMSDEDVESYEDENETDYNRADDDHGAYDDDDDDDERSSEGSYSDDPEAPDDSFYDNTRQMWVPRRHPLPQPTVPAAPPPSSRPVVIDLLSDSDDDDEPPVKTTQPLASQSKPAVAAASHGRDSVEKQITGPAEPVGPDQPPTHQNLNAGDQHDAVLEPSPGPEQMPAPSTTDRRKSSGSHLYGENVEDVSRQSVMNLHMPSTPPPDKPPAVSGANSTHEAIAVDTQDDGNASSSIPGFNGAAESRELGHGHPRPDVAAETAERGEDSHSVLDASSVLLSNAPSDEDTRVEPPEEPGNDDVDLIPAPEEVASEDQEMTDTTAAIVPPRVSSPLRSVGDADETKAGAEYTEFTKQDVEEVERMFEEGADKDAQGEDISMGEDRVRGLPAVENTQHVTETSARPDHAEPFEEPIFQDTELNANNSLTEEISSPAVKSSSLPPSPSFASQALPSSPSQAGDFGQTPTPDKAQPSGTAVQRPAVSDATQYVSDLTERAEVTTEATVETSVVLEQEPGVDGQTSEDECDASVEMIHVPAGVDRASSPAADGDTIMADELGGGDELDDETLIASQLQVEIVRTTMREGDGLTVVQESRRVSVSHISHDADSALNQDVEQTVQEGPAENMLDDDVPVTDSDLLDAPMESASLDDAVREELDLEDEVEREMASKLGEPEKPVEEEADDEVDDDEEMVDLTGDAKEDIADTEVDAEVDDGDGEILEQENTALQSGNGSEKPTNEDGSIEGRLLSLSIPAGDTAQSTMAALPDDDEVLLVGDEKASTEQPTARAVLEEDGTPASAGGAGEEAETAKTEEVLAGDHPSKPLEVEVLGKSRPQTRSLRSRGQQAKSQQAEPSDEPSLERPAKDRSPEPSKPPQRAVASKRSTRSKEQRDPSIELAKASIQKRGMTRNKLEPPVLESRRTRQRSTSLQNPVPLDATDDEEEEEEQEEDSTIALAKAALASPSKRQQSAEPPVSAAATRTQLVRRLRTTLQEFHALKGLRNYKRGLPHVMAVVACDPPEPQRTKHRDFHTTLTVTDASIAPEQVVEVQFTELHRQYLPAVKQGDAIMLRNFEVVPLSGKAFALKQVEEKSGWAVYGADYEVPGARGGSAWEMQEVVRDYLHDLRVWYDDLEVLDREKLVTAVAKLAESGDSLMG